MRAIYFIIFVIYLEPLPLGIDFYYRFKVINSGLVIEEGREFDDEYIIKRFFRKIGNSLTVFILLAI